MAMIQRVLVILLLLSLALALHTTGVQASASDTVTVYYNRACADCLRYIEETVIPLLRDAGYTDLTYKDYINEPENRTELLARSDALGVPPDLQSHLTVFVGDLLILQGHVPEGVVADLLAAPAGAFEHILVYQDKMTWPIWKSTAIILRRAPRSRSRMSAPCCHSCSLLASSTDSIRVRLPCYCSSLLSSLRSSAPPAPSGPWG